MNLSLQHRNLKPKITKRSHEKKNHKASKPLIFISTISNSNSSPTTLKITTTHFFFLNIFQLSKRFTHSPTVQTKKTQRVIKFSFKFKF